MNQFNFTSANAQIAGQKGVANGIASLDSTGKVPSTQLPADILEYASYSQFPETGDSGKIYIDTSTNIIYRWDDTEDEYVSISAGGGGGGGGGTSIVDISFSIATTDWTATTGGYSATVTNSAITNLSKEIVFYSNSVKTYLKGNIDATKDAANNAMTFFTESMPTGTITGNIYSFTNVAGPAQTVFKDITFSIATTDWTGSSSPYTATVSSSDITASSGIWVFYDATYDSYAGAPISAGISSGAGAVEFSTSVKPTGTLTGYIRIVDNVNGSIPESRLPNYAVGLTIVDGKLCVQYETEVE